MKFRINWKEITRPLQENNGNPSSTRWLLFVLFVLAIFVYLDWRWAFRLEMVREAPNYEGIEKLFIAMMVTFVGGVLLGLGLKVWQKKYERNNKEEKNE